jgi:hypothetical protein
MQLKPLSKKIASCLPSLTFFCAADEYAQHMGCYHQCGGQLLYNSLTNAAQFVWTTVAEADKQHRTEECCALTSGVTLCWKVCPLLTGQTPSG